MHLPFQRNVFLLIRSFFLTFMGLDLDSWTYFTICNLASSKTKIFFLSFVVLVCHQYANEHFQRIHLEDHPAFGQLSFHCRDLSSRSISSLKKETEYFFSLYPFTANFHLSFWAPNEGILILNDFFLFAAHRNQFYTTTEYHKLFWLSAQMQT